MSLHNNVYGDCTELIKKMKSSSTPFIIGVAGGTASGKTSVCRNITKELYASHKQSLDIDAFSRKIVTISQESFYHPLNAKDQKNAELGQYNFDHPDAFDEEFMMHTFTELRNGNSVEIPIYDYKTHQMKKDEQRVIHPSDVILFEGILVFYFKPVREMFNMKLFVDTDADTRLSRRVIRDVEERNRELDLILHNYTTLVKPAFEEFCLPTKTYADVIIPRGADNRVAIGLIVQHIQDLLKCKCNKNLKMNSIHNDPIPFTEHPATIVTATR